MFKQDMLEELAKLMDDYLNGHPNRSLGGLAYRSGVSYATLRRIHLGSTSPGPETILPLLKWICTGEQILGFMRRHYKVFSIFGGPDDIGPGSLLRDLDQIRDIVQGFDLETLVQEEGHLSFQCKGVNEEGLKKAQLTLKSAENEIKTILDHSEGIHRSIIALVLNGTEF